MFDSSALNNALVRWAEKKNLAGVSAAIMSRDGLVYSFNYGWRDAACTLPVNNDTVFGIASMSKSLTALCACILASEGRLDLDAPVCDFLPSFSARRSAARSRDRPPSRHAHFRHPADGAA